MKYLGFILAMVVWAAPAASQPMSANFPDGPGKDTVLAVCGGCHDLNRLTPGYTPEGWHTVIRMMENFGAPIPPDKVAAITSYLIESFPEKPHPPAVLIPGPVRVTIREWDVPTPGSRPHDPLAARDGSIWYTGQLANALGRLDPATGKIKEYHLKPRTGPHGLKEDKDGTIWFTGNFAGLIGKLDPKSGNVTDFPMPDPALKLQLGNNSISRVNLFWQLVSPRKATRALVRGPCRYLLCPLKNGSRIGHKSARPG